ncbi:MAG: PqqD family protein [Hyphomicrobium sp.]|uniref:PqqD family protein n=1 Tax=Hyphomicrobium sp. TaxID=82 RepID=UPI0039E5F153
MSVVSYPTQYVIASADIVSEEFDGEFVVLDLSCGKYFSMDETASAIWRAVVSGVSTQSLAEATGTNGPTNFASIHEFLQKLVGYGCLVPSDAPSSAPIDEATLQKLLTSDKPPSVEMFDDLAELIMADPIHDVEEAAGWPVRKSEVA